MNRPVAIVTEAGIGIGAATATHLARTNDLIITHLQIDAGDLTASSTLDALAVAEDDAADRLNVLVCNAGAYPRIPWSELNLGLFRQHIELNLIAHAACAKLVAPTLMARGHGRIVAISSALTHLGRVDLAGYIAAKSGLERPVRALARKLGQHRVTVNSVRAGSIEVPAGFITGQFLTVDGGWCLA